jgi:outer membrane protein assembly factor BamB
MRICFVLMWVCWSAWGLGALRCAAQDWPQWGGTLARNMVSDAHGLPDHFDPSAKADPKTRGVKWSVKLGSHTYGNPVISGGKIFVGTNNASPRDPKYVGDRNVLMCFNEADGRFLWQLVVSKVQGEADYHELGICSSPTVDGNRVYTVTSHCEILCLDTNGLANGNDGPFQDEAQYLAKPLEYKLEIGRTGPIVRLVPGPPVKLGATDADILWRYDLLTEQKVWPHDATSCSGLVYGDLVYFGTCNAKTNHRYVPYPNARSLIALDKETGKLVAVDDADIGKGIFHGSWSSPSLAVVNGRPLIFYGGGDGVCYAFDPKPAPNSDPKQPGILKNVWKCDCNPADYRTLGGKPIAYRSRKGPSEIIGTPVCYQNRVYVAVGQDPNHGSGAGCLTCIDATKTGDVSRSGKIWEFRDMDRSLSTVSIAAGLLYIADFGGTVHCLDLDTGKQLWKHETDSYIWGSTFVADGKVYFGDATGTLWILAAGREKKVLDKIKLDSTIYQTPVVANGVLYITSEQRLYAIPFAEKETHEPASASQASQAGDKPPI